jgi:hypothetical protein
MIINFQPIFDYIDKTKADIFAEVASKNEINNIKNMLDAFAKSAGDNGNKMRLQENKTERIEHWVIKAAEKTKVPYKP